MTPEPSAANQASAAFDAVIAPTYYSLLEVLPSASVQDIRRAYREKSKIYHPDTTELPSGVAQEKFLQLNEAYATLSSPERRSHYNQQIGYSSIPVIQSLQDLEQRAKTIRTSSAYLDPSDRPLSPGELFALFILGVTFVGCLVLAIIVGVTQGKVIMGTVAMPVVAPPTEVIAAQVSTPPHPAKSLPSTETASPAI